VSQVSWENREGMTGTFRNTYKSGGIDPSLFDLINLFLTLIPQSLVLLSSLFARIPPS
jgi:hypothetical protein